MSCQRPWYKWLALLSSAITVVAGIAIGLLFHPPVTYPVNVRIHPVPAHEHLRAGRSFAPNPLIDGDKLFRVEVTNTSGTTVRVTLAVPDAPRKVDGTTLAAVFDARGELVSPGARCSNSLKQIHLVGEPEPVLPVIEWAADERLTENLGLSGYSFEALEGEHRTVRPGWYQVRASFDYRNGDGAQQVAVSAPVWVRVSARHVAEWRALLGK